MVKINIEKDMDNGGSSKHFEIEKGEITVLHDMEDGKDIVRVTINGQVEFEYDVNNPDKEIIGYSTPRETTVYPKGSITIA